jgi:hypothetical protein
MKIFDFWKGKRMPKQRFLEGKRRNKRGHKRKGRMRLEKGFEGLLLNRVF